MSSILLIQSDPAASHYFTDALITEPDLAVCGCVQTLKQARTFIAARIPDMLIADLRLSDGPLFHLLRELRLGRSHTLVLTASLRDPHLMHALRHGADAYMMAGRSMETLRAGVRQVLAGESPMAPEIARQVMGHFDALSSRPIGTGGPDPLELNAIERRLLQWVSEGYLTHEIARGLGMTPTQIGMRIRTLYRKMQFDQRARQTPTRIG